MSDPLPLLLAAGLRATAVLLVALALARFVGRRRAAAGLLAASAGLLLALTVAAFLPLPDWWTCTPTSADPSAERSLERPSAAEPGAAAPMLVSFDELATLLRRAGERPKEPARPSWLARAYFAGVGLLGTRLLIGLVAVVRLRRRSRPIDDPDPRRLADELRSALGLRRAVDLRECPGLGSPATVGWRRPVVLLPDDWRTWDRDEVRAVLAHELAHVRAGDFAAGLLARVAAVVHFYHPLVHALTARLRLAQELAADAVAAPLAGGATAYRRTLARFALRLADRPTRSVHPWPSLTGGALLRRIEMLRNGTEARPLSPSLRRGLALTLLATAVLASLVRPPRPALAAPPAEAEPFDTTYVRPEAKGVVGFRPALLLSRPGFETVVAVYEAMLTHIATEAGFAGDKLPKLTEVEQIVADIHLTTKGTGEPGSRAVLVGASSFAVRTTKPFDWKGFVRSCAAAKEIAHGDRTAYRLDKGLHGVVPVSLLVADDRTLVVVTGKDDAVKTLLDHVASGSKRTWGASWEKANRSALALAFDNRDGGYTKQFATDAKPYPDLGTMLEVLRTVSVGVEVSNGLTVRAVVECGSEADATAATAAWTKLLPLARASKAEDADALAGVRTELLKAEPRAEGTTMVWEGRSAVLLAELVKAMTAGATAEEKPKP